MHITLLILVHLGKGAFSTFNPEVLYLFKFSKYVRELLYIHLFLFLSVFIYFERESVRSRGRERRRERPSQAGAIVSAQSLVLGLKITTHEMTTWPELRVRHLTD